MRSETSGAAKATSGLRKIALPGGRQGGNDADVRTAAGSCVHQLWTSLSNIHAATPAAASVPVSCTASKPGHDTNPGVEPLETVGSRNEPLRARVPAAETFSHRTEPAGNASSSVISSNV